jgi:hypothetical protein
MAALGSARLSAPALGDLSLADVDAIGVMEAAVQ